MLSNFEGVSLLQILGPEFKFLISIFDQRPQVLIDFDVPVFVGSDLSVCNVEVELPQLLGELRLFVFFPEKELFLNVVEVHELVLTQHVLLGQVVFVFFIEGEEISFGVQVPGDYEVNWALGFVVLISHYNPLQY